MFSILNHTKELLFDICGLEMVNIEIEKESLDYCASKFIINNKKILFRRAKITPTKSGQFVTLWKRINADSAIQPFDNSDDIDLFVISVNTETRHGQFIFPKSILVEKGIVTNKKAGKRAIRVYPIWDVPTSKLAQKTQKWQLDYFLEIPDEGKLDTIQARIFYS